MNIYFFGSSHGYPEANRKCSCTMIEISGHYYFVDMGMMAIDEMVTRNIAIESVRGIFITHQHGDHVNGLIDFADLVSWHYKKANPVVCLPRIEAARIIKDWISLNGDGRKELHYEEIKPGIIFDDGIVKVTAILTQHIFKAYAFLLEAEGKSVLFTGDLQKPSIDFPQIAREREIDLAICEGAHFPATEYGSVLTECKIKKVCINHYVPWNIPNIQQLEKTLDDIEIITANDGMRIVL